MTIFICCHCATSCSENQKFCRNCKTAEDRQKMCNDNRSNNPNHKCAPLHYDCKPCKLDDTTAIKTEVITEPVL